MEQDSFICGPRCYCSLASAEIHLNSQNCAWHCATLLPLWNSLGGVVMSFLDLSHLQGFHPALAWGVSLCCSSVPQCCLEMSMLCQTCRATMARGKAPMHVPPWALSCPWFTFTGWTALHLSWNS